MGRMIRQKKEWRCSKCGFRHLKFEGTCRSCKAVATLQEFQLVPIKPKEKPTQKSLRRRSIKSEQNIGRTMLQADGPDPFYSRVASSTGRVGHITNMRVDAISKHYVIENKNRVLPKWLIDAWLLIQQRAIDFNKEALLHLDPPNAPKEFPINGEKQKMSTLCVITQKRHAELLEKERELEELQAHGV